ncbi:MAG: DUF2066 domain-containing protein [Gammaproteobacteria bacterium]
MNVLIRGLIVSGLLLCQNIFAAEVKNLFQIEVMAKSQTQADRNEAIKEAMTIVLQRVMAGDKVLDDPTVQMALAQAPYYVKQYQYALVENAYDTDGSARQMRVLFDEASLLDLLKTGKLGIWSEIRPETLVWLVIEDQGQRRFFKPETMPGFDNAINQAAKRKGLPLIFPLLDLEEREHISVNDVLSAYPEQLLDVSSRYDVVSVLAGRVVNKQGCWQGEWALYFDQGVEQWIHPCLTLKEALLGGMDGAYNTLSRYYSVKPDVLEVGTALLNVAGITSMTDISRVSEYLESLPMVKSVKWVSVKEGFNRYQISYEGDRRVFKNWIDAGQVLEAFTSSGLAPDELSFRLMPETGEFVVDH